MSVLEHVGRCGKKERRVLVSNGFKFLSHLNDLLLRFEKHRTGREASMNLSRARGGADCAQLQEKREEVLAVRETLEELAIFARFLDLEGLDAASKNTQRNVRDSRFDLLGIRA